MGFQRKSRGSGERMHRDKKNKFASNVAVQKGHLAKTATEVLLTSVLQLQLFHHLRNCSNILSKTNSREICIAVGV